MCLIISAAPNPLADTLDLFYEDVVAIPEKKITATKLKVTTLMDYIMPRLSKLSNAVGMKVNGRVYAGSTFDDTQVILPHDIDVYILFELAKNWILF